MNGIATWCCFEDIRTADEWESRIREELKQCDWFLIVISASPTQSDWVRAEVHWAIENMKGHVIPIHLNACKPENLHLKLSAIQYIDLRNNQKRVKGRISIIHY